MLSRLYKAVCFYVLDVDYRLSDAMMFEIIARAKLLSEPGASGADIINLIRRVTEYEADVKNNVDYFVTSLAERTVFEFTKKKIAGKYTSVSINQQCTILDVFLFFLGHFMLPIRDFTFHRQLLTNVIRISYCNSLLIVFFHMSFSSS